MLLELKSTKVLDMSSINRINLADIRIFVELAQAGSFYQGC